MRIARKIAAIIAVTVAWLTVGIIYHHDTRFYFAGIIVVSSLSVIFLISDLLLFRKKSRERQEDEKSTDEYYRRLVGSYRRFVPESVLSLLRKKSVMEVDKDTFTIRTMGIMRVFIVFPKEVYSKSSDSTRLFDSINDVMEQTTQIITEQSGAVFNYSYNGYNAVMDPEPVRLISTAVRVRQRVISFNEGRRKLGLPEAGFHVALDIGDVVLGIVGDSAQMAPTAISTGFTIVTKLLALCKELDANILCTEPVTAGSGGYGSRYIGRAATDGGSFRVYEIYDGDPYEMRKEKEKSAKAFSQGILSLYSADLSEAKRQFLEIVHAAPDDGAAKYYLYLADSLEKEGDEGGIKEAML